MSTKLTSNKLIWVSRTKIPRGKWNRFNELAKSIGITRDQLLEKVVTAALNSYEVEVHVKRKCGDGHIAHDHTASI